MDSKTADGLVNEVLYGIDKVKDLGSDEVLARYADSLINQRNFLSPVSEYAEAVGRAVRAGRLPYPAEELSRRFARAELLDFLARLASCLDELRPWPAPAFLKLDIGEWDTFARAKAIARIHCPAMEISGILNRSFDSVPLAPGKMAVIILRLRTGEVVAITSADPRSTVFTLLHRGTGNPHEVIEHLLAMTRFSPEEIVQLME